MLLPLANALSIHDLTSRGRKLKMRSSGEDDMNWRGEGAGDVLQKPQSSKMVHQSALSRVVRGCRASAYVNARVCVARSQCTYAPWSGAVSAMCMCFSEARAGAMRATAASSEGHLVPVGRAKASTWMGICATGRTVGCPGWFPPWLGPILGPTSA